LIVFEIWFVKRSKFVKKGQHFFVICWMIWRICLCYWNEFDLNFES
jgi:hypothetical protein